jgi:Glycosyltransferase like family 2
VPTRGRADSVARLLSSLALACWRYPGRAEVILSDASPGVAHDRIRRLADDADARIVAGRSGIGRQRNLGWRVARGDVVAFVDSDCSATPDLLRALTVAFREPSVIAVAGRVSFTGPRSPALDAAVATGVVAAFDGFGKETGERVPWGVTANLAVRRDALEAVGGFDEEMPAGEDVDLGLRLSRFGEMRYVPDAVVEHHTDTWNALVPIAARFFRYGRADAHLRAAHPGVRGGAEPSVLPALALSLLLSARRAAQGRPRAAAPVAAWLVSLAGVLATGRGTLGTSALALALMESLSAGRAAEAVRLRRWGDVWRGVVLDEGQREREASRRRRAWLAAAVPGLAAVAAVRGGRWRRSRS